MRPPDRISRGFALSDFRTQESYHRQGHFRVPRDCQGDAARGCEELLLIMRSKQANSPVVVQAFLRIQLFADAGNDALYPFTGKGEGSPDSVIRRHTDHANFHSRFVDDKRQRYKARGGAIVRAAGTNDFGVGKESYSGAIGVDRIRTVV